MKSILDKNFRYTSAAQTDVGKTIRREQKRLADEARREQEARASVPMIGRKVVGK